jgi:hypothetical protein
MTFVARHDRRGRWPFGSALSVLPKRFKIGCRNRHEAE